MIQKTTMINSTIIKTIFSFIHIVYRNISSKMKKYQACIFDKYRVRTNGKRAVDKNQT